MSEKTLHSGMLWQSDADPADAIAEALAYYRGKYGEPEAIALRTLPECECGVDLVQDARIAEGHYWVGRYETQSDGRE